MDNVWKQIFEEFSKKLYSEKFENECSICTNESMEINYDEIKKLYNGMQNLKPSIKEICVTNKLKGDFIQILHEKYLCMNEKCFKLLQNELIICSDNYIYGIPFYIGKKADEKFLEYWKEIEKGLVILRKWNIPRMLSL